MSVTMSNTSAPKFDEIRKFLGNMTQPEILRYALGFENPNAPDGAENVLVVIIDTEHFVFKPRVLTELGTHTFTRKEMKAALENPGPKGENMLKAIWYYHLRFKDNAHYINRKHCVADPENNHFGNSRFVTNAQAKCFLEASFGWPIDEQRPELGTCPVIVMGHSIHNDLKILHDLDVDPEVHNNVVAEMDTQDIAAYKNIHGTGQRIGLEVLMGKLGIEFRDGHTASNDAAYTVIAGLYMVMKPEEFSAGSENVTRQQVVDKVAAHSKLCQPDLGLEHLCTRCGSEKHNRPGCRVKIRWCEKCIGAGNENAARTHITAMCTRT